MYAGSVKPLPANDLEHVLSHTRQLWEEVRGRRIFLSGATGFFGAWLLESLLHCNRVLQSECVRHRTLPRSGSVSRAKCRTSRTDTSITLWQGNVCNFDVPEHEFTYVVHAAAPTSAEAAGRPLGVVEHHRGWHAAHAGAGMPSHNTKKFLFVSSGAVYGKQPEHISHIPEDYLGGPGLA